MSGATQKAPVIPVEHDPQRARRARPPESSGWSAAARFVRACWLRLLVISAAVLTPCFWHRRLEAGDLGSHVYNAWLAQLVERGQAPGLYLVRQWTNVLFDAALGSLEGLVGLHVAERLVTAAAVLLFFWGAFAVICAISRRAPWFVLPCLAAFTYGWTFEMGFMNYYISLGFAFLGLAIVVRGRGKERFAALALAPLIFLAHPLGLIFLLGTGTYVVLSQGLSPRRQIYLFAAAGFVFLLLRLYLMSHYDTLPPPAPLYLYTGGDQLFLFGRAYRLLAELLLAFALLGLLIDFADRCKTPGVAAAFRPYRLPLQLYGAALLAALLLPTLVRTRLSEAPVSFLVERLTSVTAVFLCCLLGVMKPKRWHLVGFATIAAVFFFYLYADTGSIDRMEAQAEHHVALLPPGRRVVATIRPFLHSRVFIHHIVDRACIGRCFSYGNYEPSSGQFRVRVRPGSPVVTADYADTNAMQFGDYIVQPQDLPLSEIYQCNLNMTVLCMRELSVGDSTGKYGLQAPLPR